jgi:hypothetical protein
MDDVEIDTLFAALTYRFIQLLEIQRTLFGFVQQRIGIADIGHTEMAETLYHSNQKLMFIRREDVDRGYDVVFVSHHIDIGHYLRQIFIGLPLIGERFYDHFGRKCGENISLWELFLDVGLKLKIAFLLYDRAEA